MKYCSKMIEISLCKFHVHVLVTLRYNGNLTIARHMQFIAVPYFPFFRHLTLHIIGGLTCSCSFVYPMIEGLHLLPTKLSQKNISSRPFLKL